MIFPDPREYAKKYDGTSDMAAVCRNMLDEGFPKPFIVIVIRIITHKDFEEAHEIASNYLNNK